jgi:competence protein ComEA
LAERKQKRFWAVIVLILLAVTVISAVIAWTKYRPAQPIEITLPTEPQLQGTVQIGGAVVNPGIYPFTGQDSIASLIQSAGGVTTTESPNQLGLNIPETGSQNPVQKININRAEIWLLEALPGIGVTKAKAIIAYRESHGPFKQTIELTKVEGIGPTLFEQIKNFVTVTD